jgi:protein-S-isoprenylcysteine O-methyltransferase Ste14
MRPEHPSRQQDGDLGSAPNRLPWPPMIYVAATILAVAANHLRPLQLDMAPTFLRPLGAALLAIGLGLDVWSMITMSRCRANILPHRAATALVTTGPFAWSRNPIYLGNTIALMGAGLAFANPWLMPAAIIAAFAVLRLAILREEVHLAMRFGTAWDRYRGRTARWFGKTGDR